VLPCVRKFLEHNAKLQVTVTFPGREMQHLAEGLRVLDALPGKLAEVGKAERPPTMDGTNMTAMLMPIKAVSKAPQSSG
jgi:translation initiation factor IF-3